jgi:hypothetical protein
VSTVLHDPEERLGATLAQRSRETQGLPPRVTDPAALAQVAEILAACDNAGPEGPAHRYFPTTSTASPDGGDQGAG